VSWAWWDWPLTWLTNRRPSVLWHCWLGHLTRKIVSKMTYDVSSGMLNTTLPYHAFHMKCQRQMLGTRWFRPVVSNVDMHALTGLTPLGEILAAHRISVSGCITRLESDVPAHMVLGRHIDLSVGSPPGPNWRRRPGRPRTWWIDQIPQDSRSSQVELWRCAVRHGHAAWVTYRPSPAMRHWWWWVLSQDQN